MRTHLKIAAIVAILLGAVLTSIPAQAQGDRRVYLEDRHGNEIGSGKIREDGRASIDLDKGGELTGKMKSNNRLTLEDERGKEYEFRCRSNGRCERDD